METGQQTALSNDEKPLSSPKLVPCDDTGDDILLDTYFDHSQPLDSNALDALLNTKFSTSFDDVDQSTDSIAAQWRPAQPEVPMQQQSPSRTRMELSSPHEKHGALKPGALKPEQSDHPFTFSQVHPYAPSVHATSTYHDPSYPGRTSPFDSYEQTPMMRQSHGLMPAHMGQVHYYPTSGPVAMPTMSEVYPDVPTQLQQTGYYSSSHASRQGTADLMDYENTIPEEDEAGSVANGEIADPCYAQLLYRCLREAPEHTMALKDVYKWVRQYSQKARDSAGTGWQNSVRHNLSMNAVSAQESSTTIHLLLQS